MARALPQRLVKACFLMIISLVLPVQAETMRRALPQPFDSVFSLTEYLGPTIGVPNTDPTYPLTDLIWKSAPGFKENDIRVYGWVDPGANASTSKHSNIPLSYDIVPNHLELDQFVVRIERQPDTVQTSYLDWGFRLTNLYGIDYRYTIAQSIFSDQLLKRNQLYGDDPLEAYAQIYFPNLAQGAVLTIGRYISPPDIEGQLAPQNFLFTHSLMFTYDAYTMMGANITIKFDNQWSILLGLNGGNDVALWSQAAHIPTGQGLVRWVANDNNDSLWGGMTTLNGGAFKDGHSNFQEFNLTWSHRFNSAFFVMTEAYYIYQRDARLGGTCIVGPIKSYGGGGGCGPLIPGISPDWGAVSYWEHQLTDKRFLSFRLDWLNDVTGAQTGFATQYYSITLGITQKLNSLVEFRPEVRYESAFGSNETPYDNGTKRAQTTVAMDMIGRF